MFRPVNTRHDLKVGDKSFTENFNVLIDPRIAADGVTVADLQEQYEHNMRMRALVNDMNRLVARVREAQRNSNATGRQWRINRASECAGGEASD